MNVELWVDDAELAALREENAEVPDRSRLLRWCEAALEAAESPLGVDCAGEDLSAVTISLAFPTAAGMRALNATWRGRDAVTNVLSFPAEQRPLPGLPWVLGDIALCPSRVREEAQTQSKSLEAHYAHLLVHGVLHLLGHDHLEDAAAERMERLEVQILAGLGYADPYSSDSTTWTP